MTARMAHALAAADAARDALLHFVHATDASRFAVRQSESSWSPLEILEHLRLTEDGVVRLLAHRLMRARERGLVAVDPSASADGDAIVLEGGRIDAPATLVPSGDLVLPRVVDGLSASRAALRQLASEVAPFDGTAVTARHVVLGELHFYQWVHFIGAHDRRHQNQMARILGTA